MAFIDVFMHQSPLLHKALVAASSQGLGALSSTPSASLWYHPPITAHVVFVETQAAAPGVVKKNFYPENRTLEEKMGFLRGG
jgi:hypothetical protein